MDQRTECEHRNNLLEDKTGKTVQVIGVGKDRKPLALEIVPRINKWGLGI